MADLCEVELEPYWRATVAQTAENVMATFQPSAQADHFQP